MRPFIGAAGLSAALVACALGAPAAAQVVRGTVAGERLHQPVPMAVIRLEDERGARRGSVLTDSLGRFVIRPAAPGRYRLRVERIGYQATTVAPFNVAEGQTVERDLVASEAATILTDITITLSDRCTVKPDEGALAARVWASARTALDALLATHQQQLLVVNRSVLDRELSSTGTLVRQKQAVTTDLMANPFVSAPAESLAAYGYMRILGDSVEYFAPDAAVLLSDAFADGHCVRVVPDDSAHAGAVGLAFEPAKGRHVSDIRGVLWVDRKTSELRTFDYSYTELPGGFTSAAFGGHVQFRSLASGAWIVDSWLIRMPYLERITRVGSVRGTGDAVTLAGVREHGGDVLGMAARDGSALLEVAMETVQGTVFDSAHGGPLVGAIVRIDGTSVQTSTDAGGRYSFSVPKSQVVARVSHPELAELGLPSLSASITVPAGDSAVEDFAIPPVARLIAAVCRSMADNVIVGTVRDATTGDVLVADTVVMSWREWAGASAPTAWHDRRATLVTDSVGRYRVCGAPVNATLTLHAADATNPTGAAALELSPGSIEIRDLAVRRGATASTVGASALRVRVTVLEGLPAVGAVVSIVGTPLSERTDSSGIARFGRLPEGTVIVAARKIGMTQSLRTAELTSRQNATLDVALTRPPQVLASRQIRGSRRLLSEFELRRRGGVGYFLTTADIDARAAMDVISLVAMAPGVILVPARSGGYQATTRFGARPDLGEAGYGLATLGGSKTAGTASPPNRGTYTGTSCGTMNPDANVSSAASSEKACPGKICQIAYFVDGAKVTPIDGRIDDLEHPKDIGAMEIYTSGTTVPARYSTHDSSCGAVLIWTRTQRDTVAH